MLLSELLSTFEKVSDETILKTTCYSPAFSIGLQDGDFDNLRIASQENGVYFQYSSDEQTTIGDLRNLSKENSEIFVDVETNFNYFPVDTLRSVSNFVVLFPKTEDFNFCSTFD